MMSLTRYHEGMDEANINVDSYHLSPMSSWVDTKALLEWGSFGGRDYPISLLNSGLSCLV